MNSLTVPKMYKGTIFIYINSVAKYQKRESRPFDAIQKKLEKSPEAEKTEVKNTKIVEKGASFFDVCSMFWTWVVHVEQMNKTMDHTRIKNNPL